MDLKPIALCCAALLMASLAFSFRALSQNANLVAPGRVEAAGPAMSLGVAASGTVDKILVQQGSHVRAGQTLVSLDCRPLEAEVRGREARLAAAQAAFDRLRDGARPDEIAVGEAVVGDSLARSDEAKKTLDRTAALQEGVTVSTARVLEVERDARIATAQLAEARARLSLLRAGAREEDIRQGQALRDAAAADLDAERAQFEQCNVRAPVDGVVAEVLANAGQYFSTALPQALLRMVPDGPPRIRAEVELHDAPRICVGQNATVAAAAQPGATTGAEVTLVGPTAGTPTMPSAAPGVHDATVVPVILRVTSGAPPPVGTTVTVHFDACPSKS